MSIARLRLTFGVCAALALLSAPSLAEPLSRADGDGPADVARLLVDDDALRGWLSAHDHEVEADRARVAAAKADVQAAGLFRNPELDVGVSNIPLGVTNPPGLGWGQTNAYSVGLSQTFELGKRGPRTDAAKLRLASAVETSRGSFHSRVAAARLALAQVVYLKARRDVLGEQLRSAQSANELQKTRRDHGDLSGNDYDRLLLETTTLSLETSAAQTAYVSALADCQAIMLAPCAEPSTTEVLALAARLPSALSAPPAPPQVRALDLAADAARADATLARRRAIPDPTLRIGYTHSQFTISGDNANTLEASLSIPLPFFDHGQADAAMAKAREQELRAMAKSYEASARAMIAGLTAQKSALEQGMSELQTVAIPRSQVVLDAMEQALSRGQVDMTSLLSARRGHKDLLLRLLDVEYELFAVRNELRRALGLDLDPKKGTSS